MYMHVPGLKAGKAVSSGSRARWGLGRAVILFTDLLAPWETVGGLRSRAPSLEM